MNEWEKNFIVENTRQITPHSEVKAENSEWEKTVAILKFIISGN